MSAEDEVAKLKTLFPGAQALQDGTNIFVFLPKLLIRTEGKTMERDALLCPQSHSGYQTRLFLSNPIPGKGTNWTTHSLFTRPWHTWSWQHIVANQPWANILASHLAALQ